MRLTCPNCEAQYEVPDEVIPVDGLDVQCSNCGQTWFQYHRDHMPEETETAELTEDAPDPDEEVSPAPPPPPPPSAAPPQQELDPAVADILREEAEAEFEARRKREAEALESQPDLGLESSGRDWERDEPQATDQEAENAKAKEEAEAEQRTLEARKRMAQMRGEPEPGSEAAAAAAAMSSRRQLLPDIEEINSTLRNDTAPSGNDGNAREELGAGGSPKEKRSFKLGFRTIIVIAVILLLIYVFAPQISQAVPALDPVLSGYVGLIDQIRLAINGLVLRIFDWLNAAAASDGGA